MKRFLTFSPLASLIQMVLSDEEFEKKLEKILPQKLKELGLFYSVTELATKEEIKDLIREMNRRFEQVDRRFEATLQEIKTISAGLGTLGNRTGNEFEELVRSIFKEVLGKEGIDTEKIEKHTIRNTDPNILKV